MITIHGSILTTPDSARDVDVVFYAPHTRADAEAAALRFLADRGLQVRPVDAQQSAYVPALPVGPLPPAQRLDPGTPPEYRRQYDVAAWIRACASAEGRAAFLAAWRSEPWDTRWIGDSGRGRAANHLALGVVLVTRPSPLCGAYHGGGPAAVRAAIEKCPQAWAWMRQQIPPQAALIESLAADAPFTGTLRAMLQGAPAASNGELQMCARGLVAAYAPEPLAWGSVK